MIDCSSIYCVSNHSDQNDHCHHYENHSPEMTYLPECSALFDRGNVWTVFQFWRNHSHHMELCKLAVAIVALTLKT